MSSSLREEYENLFLFLRNNLKLGVRIDLDVDEYTDVYYLSGKMRGTEFTIDIIDGDLSVSIKNGGNLRDAYLEDVLSEYKKERPSVQYFVRDITNPHRMIRVFEWTDKLERVDALINNTTLEYPFFVTGVELLKDFEKKSSKKKSK